jgi:hypothetical protein
LLKKRVLSHADIADLTVQRYFDAFQFCRHLKRHMPESVAPAEWNRLVFALSKRKAALHWIAMRMTETKTRQGFQFFFRGRGQKWREFFFYVAL